MPNELVMASAVDQNAFNICDWSDSQINDLLGAISSAVNSPNSDYTSGAFTVEAGKVKSTQFTLFSGDGIDPQSGAGALVIDRLMSELSNLESISANAVATSQRIQKEINSKLS